MTHLQNRVVDNASFWCNRVKITQHQRQLHMYARIGELLEHLLSEVTGNTDIDKQTTTTTTTTTDSNSYIDTTSTPTYDHYHQTNSNKVFANPVTLNLRLLVQLNYNDYYIAPKVDGERHLLWIRHNQVFLLNRACTHLRAVGQCDEWLPWHDSVFDVELLPSLPSSQSLQKSFYSTFSGFNLFHYTNTHLKNANKKSSIFCAPFGTLPRTFKYNNISISIK